MRIIQKINRRYRMKLLKKVSALALVSLLVLTGCSSSKTSEQESAGVADEKILSMDYKDYEKESKGTTVTIYGWGGSDQTNNWIDHYLADKLKKEYDITLKRTGMNIDEILNNLQNSVQAKEEKGNIDVIWINGENFYTAMKSNLLFGPFVDKLPNFEKYVDTKSSDVLFDFGHETKGYEAPFGKAQLVMIYNSDKLKEIKSADDLMAAAKANPGKITYPAPPDFTGSAFVRNIVYEKVGYDKLKDLDPNDKEAIRTAMKPALDYLKELKPYLWKEGKTYPAESTQLDNMFADGSVYFDVSYNTNFASNMIDKGTFPKSTRTSIFDKGTIGNTHFLAIAKNAPNKKGAMVVINEILNFESQMEKYKPTVWGDLPVIDNSKLSDEQKNAIDGVEKGLATLAQDQLLSKRQPELPAAMVPVIEAIWAEEIPNK